MKKKSARVPITLIFNGNRSPKKSLPKGHIPPKLPLKEGSDIRNGCTLGLRYFYNIFFFPINKTEQNTL